MPEILYHYTGPSAFRSIVERAELWASDVRMLNDEGELKYAWDELISVLQQRESEESDYSEAYAATLQAITSAKSTDPDSIEDRVFATSLTEAGDDYTMWAEYAPKGKGMALGFVAEQMQLLPVPYFYHTPGGVLVPAMATVAGTSDQVQMTWGAVLDQVKYGDAEREKAIGNVLWKVEQICQTNDVGTRAQKVVNSIFRIPEYLSMLALVKGGGWGIEQEWRITIPEHFGSSSASAKSAFTQVEGFQFLAQGPLMTVNVQFREGSRAAFIPYAVIPFPKPALARVVIGPNVDDPDLAAGATRRLLDRHGFRDTAVIKSANPRRV